MLDQDFHSIKKGESYTAPIDGHFISDAYLADSFDASVEELKK